MTAKHKLNEANLMVCLLVAGLVGGLTQSLLIFTFAFFVLAAAALYAGDIRK
jgi:hypothetical protein